MTIREMHYDFKRKLNKVDSQKYVNLTVPEIDWALNEAMTMFIKSVAEPRFSKEIGFEFNERTIDDLGTLVVNQSTDNSTCLAATVFDNTSYTVDLPTDYFFYVSSEVIATKGTCTNVKLRGLQKQHDDKHEESPFDNSNFEWREANIRRLGNKLRVFTDGTFTVSYLCMNYIRVPLYMQNAQDYPGNTYNKLDGTALVTFQNCELPFHVHNEIVDLAVQITTLNLDNPNYSLKKEKSELNN